MTQTASSGTGPAAAVFNPFVAPHKDDPFPFYHQARLESPVAFNPIFGAWLVTRYDDIATVVNDTERFSSTAAVPVFTEANPPEVLAELVGVVPLGRWPVLVDPPDHDVVRGVANYIFRGPRVNALRPAMRQLADQLIAGFASAGSAELVWNFADPFVRGNLCTLVGVPLADADRVRRWTDDFITLMNPTAPLDAKLAAAAQMHRYDEYVLNLLEQRRAEPRDDMLSDLVNGGDKLDTALSEADLVTFFRGLFVAGVDTTRDGITSALLNMMNSPEHAAQARQDRRVVATLFEETLRRDAPHRGLARVTTVDVELGGVALPAGSLLMLQFGSANRDETRFPDPDEFRPDRENLRDHLAFGQGIHLCVGAHLARTEAQVALEALLDRLPELRLAAGFEPSYIPSLWFRGLSELNVVW